MKNKEKENLFEALAVMSLPLEKACDRALEIIKNDNSIPNINKKHAEEAVKALLFHSLELHDFARINCSDLDFMNQGKERYDYIRNKVEKLILDLSLKSNQRGQSLRDPHKLI